MTEDYVCECDKSCGLGYSQEDRDVLVKLRDVLENDSIHRFYIRHIDCNALENFTVSYYGEAKLAHLID